ncbi:DNA topoisomerase 4 subunit A [Methyloversatilis universalis FAM5]|uniref:DNA topoisomerase 4 subunit A n=1 Tax=Methyloversatilis universalis (strain ATCC BAA-1314 / DSM 25237 / JCM 13912 / CCUG 52030 / FAM5) TaxID=1000565 RepID=F5R9E0_METUF|nr:DNA topoisomerase IV subunit A [Methyloversatilis universalis]EGK73010.1 DNA topoisomerase 4 subunit A [Methyloversatilis universalis FAM5]
MTDNLFEPDIADIPVDAHAAQAYLTYAMSVVTSRALPGLEDGMKPVQRRILFAMDGFARPDAAHKKSARVVGDVIGKYHPHGDSSVYEAMVRLAQPFTLRYPLIDGQGNFGSMDGDNAAAMRYTECRLTPFARHVLLSELNAGVVEFQPNYDGTQQEPSLLPARLPVVLANGASGIAVGMACEIPPHNLRELGEATCRLLVDPRMPDDDIIDCIQGPDFPNGATLISSRESIVAAYKEGRGSFRMRANYEVEGLARGQWQIVVSALPPGVSTGAVMSRIDDLANPKPKGDKKKISDDQARTKTLATSLIDSVRDESDARHPVRLVIEPKSRAVSQEDLLAFLFAYTDLECNASLNLTLLDTHRRPGQIGLPAVLRQWCDYRLGAVTRRLTQRIADIDDRMHILDGRLAILLDIDRAIAIIRAADDPKADLMAGFGITERQAEDVLEIRLRQLARLEAIKLQGERDALHAERTGLLKLLGSDSALRTFVRDEVRADVERFGDERRTLINADVQATRTREVPQIDEAVTVIVSRGGFGRLRSGHDVDEAALTWKADDGPLAVLKCRTVWPVVLMDGDGRTYTIKPTDLPSGKGDGVPVSSLADLAGKKLVAVLTGEPGSRFLVASDSGYGFVCAIEDMVSRQRAGKAFLNTDGGTALAPVKLLPADRWVVAQGGDRLLAFPLEEMKTLSGGKGVKIMTLPEGESLALLTLFREKLALPVAGSRGRAKTLNIDENALMAWRGVRATKGRKLDG